MKSLVDHLSQYAAYHRDPHNIATHFVGIPLIVIAVATLLSRPQWAGVSPAMLVMVASAIFYLRLELRLGLLMTVLLALSVWLCFASGFANDRRTNLASPALSNSESNRCPWVCASSGMCVTESV